MRVLVVEDEKDLNRVITRKLKAEGYSVDVYKRQVWCENYKPCIRCGKDSTEDS